MKLAFSSLSQLTALNDLIRYLSINLDQVARLADNGITFSDNVNAEAISATFSLVNTDTVIPHNLNRVPTGYIITGLSANAVIYDGLKKNSSFNLYLRSSSVVGARFLVF